MTSGSRSRVLVAGGGIAALEGVLALRDLVGDRAEITLVTPDADFTLKPLAVAEPFGLAHSPRIPYGEIAEELGLDLRRDTLASIDVDGREARTGSGEGIPFDAALIAIGAVAGESLPGATTYGGGRDNAEIESVLAGLDQGTVRSVAFVVPQRAAWPLPVYELALMTADRVRRDGLQAELSLVTHEARPLDLFGPKASESVDGLLHDAGIERVTSAHAAVAGPVGVQLADGRVIVADRVIASPSLSALAIQGVPTGPEGFIETDLAMEVKGAPRVFAAGDATWFPVKQGGLAAQQADVAATSIASLIDDSIERATFRPMLRGVLFTGDAPRFLRSDLSRRAGTSTSSDEPLWWPPGKVAGRHIAAFFARRAGETTELEDVEPEHEDEDFGEALELALAAADLDAKDGDYTGALRWLEVAESINLSLPEAYAEKRREWSLRVRAGKLS